MERKKLLEAEWSSKNIKPFSSYTKGSNHKAFWEHTCECGEKHEWKTSIHDRYKTNCPICSGKGKAKICPCKSLSSLLPEIALQWNYDKNKLLPEEVLPKSNRKVWWVCNKNKCEHKHEWESVISDRLKNGCPYCSGRKICICNSIAKIDRIIAEWHPEKNIGLEPSQFSKGSHVKIWWKCSKVECEHHIWQAAICDRIGDGNNCPFCDKKKICPCESLAIFRPDLCKEWHPEKNKKQPGEVAHFSNKKAWWKCSRDHIWAAVICSRTKGGNGCPVCKENKGEKHIREILTKLGLEFIPQKKISYKECKKLLFDFFLPKHNLAIEFDGLQHFEPVKYFGGEEKFKVQKHNDLYKKMFCQEAGLSLLRIHYKDIAEAEELIDLAVSAKFIFIMLSTHYVFL